MTWLDTTGAALHVRRNVHEVRRLAKAGDIPAHKNKGRWRFDQDELDAWIRGDEPAAPRRITTRPRRRAS